MEWSERSADGMENTASSCPLCDLCFFFFLAQPITDTGSTSSVARLDDFPPNWATFYLFLHHLGGFHQWQVRLSSNEPAPLILRLMTTISCTTLMFYFLFQLTFCQSFVVKVQNFFLIEKKIGLFIWPLNKVLRHSHFSPISKLGE